MPDSSPNPSLSPPIPDEDPAEAALPLPLSASLVLTSLPQDATAALAKASDHDVDGIPPKVTIRFRPVGAAPRLRQAVVKVSSANRFETVVGFLSRKLLKGAEGESDAGAGAGLGVGVFCYVNSVFAPGLDEGVGGLWKCFKTDDQLIVAYSMTPAFG